MIAPIVATPDTTKISEIFSAIIEIIYNVVMDFLNVEKGQRLSFSVLEMYEKAKLSRSDAITHHNLPQKWHETHFERFTEYWTDTQPDYHFLGEESQEESQERVALAIQENRFHQPSFAPR